MTKDEEWRFEAWRVCTACGGTGEPPPKKTSEPTSVFSGPTECRKCDGKKRETKAFTLVQLAAELKSLTF